jgi:hypothetical protein
MKEKFLMLDGEGGKKKFKKIAKEHKTLKIFFCDLAKA